MRPYVRPFRLLFLSCFSLFTLSCGGGGGGADPVVAVSNRLFAIDTFNWALASIPSANPEPGEMVVDKIIAGPHTGLTGRAESLWLDAPNGRMYVANGLSILVFNNVGKATGDVRPARTITSGSFGNVTQLFLDASNDVLYVGDDLKGIWVIDNASAANGSVTPSRQITGYFGGSNYVIAGLAVDIARDLLYVAARVTGIGDQIIVFGNASTLDGGALTPTRVFSFSPGNPGQILLDPAADRIFMADSGSYAVKVFDNASTLSGAVTPRSINLGATVTDIALDTQSNRLYALNSSQLYIIGNASTATGVAGATMIQAPADPMTLLNAVAVAP